MEVEREKEEGERVWGERKEELQNRVTEVGVSREGGGGGGLVLQLHSRFLNDFLTQHTCVTKHDHTPYLIRPHPLANKIHF